ncbi:MAG: 50S ribosomal protein L19e [Candidatus Altiarchaeota archaeon]|nr:50S ribosomal protein L19e [Candidatus Altiarchaeota archaeon]
MNLLSQKNLAAKIMKVGATRVQFNPERLEDVAGALTREDIRGLIKSGAINAKQKKGNSRGRIRFKNEQKAKGRSKGHGNRTGKKTARTPPKTKWINKIRALRNELRKMRDEKVIEPGMYRKLYLQAKGNLFQSRRHLRESVKRMKR